MSANLRPYKDLFPQTGQRVMIDATSVAIGDVRMADDVSIWPLVAIRGDVNYVATVPALTFRTVACYMSPTNPPLTLRGIL